MAPSLETFFTTGGDPIGILRNPASPYNYEMIIQFLDLDSKTRVIEETSSCDEFRKQVPEFEKKYSVSFSQLLSVKQAVMDMLLSIHKPIPGLDPFVSMYLGDIMRQAGIRDWKNQAFQIGESSKTLHQTIPGVDTFVSMNLGDMTRQAGVRDWKNQALQIGESSRTLHQTIPGLDSFVSIDIGDMMRQAGIRDWKNQAFQIGESSKTLHQTIPGVDSFVSMDPGDMTRQAGVRDWKNQALQVGESSRTLHQTIPGLDSFVSIDIGDMMRQAGIRDWKNQALQIGESSRTLDQTIPGLDSFVSMDLGDMMRQSGIRDWKNQALQIGESSRTLHQTIPGLNSFVSIDLGDMTRQGGIRDREGRNQAIQLGESRSILENVGNPNAEVRRIAAASDIADPADSEIEIDQLSQKETTESKRISAPKPVKLGKTFFPLNVQASLTLLTIFFTSVGSEVKQLLQVAAAGNMVGYLACLTEISLRKTHAKIANIMGRIGSTAAIFGFTIMMGSLLANKPALSISVAAIVALVFFVVVAKMEKK